MSGATLHYSKPTTTYPPPKCLRYTLLSLLFFSNWFYYLEYLQHIFLPLYRLLFSTQQFLKSFQNHLKILLKLPRIFFWHALFCFLLSTSQHDPPLPALSFHSSIPLFGTKSCHCQCWKIQDRQISNLLLAHKRQICIYLQRMRASRHQPLYKCSL